jgi:hypothetical protein
MVASKKRPENRTGAGSGNANDPRYIKVSAGSATGSEHPIPTADPSWKPKARSWYNSLALSGQSQFYEPCDWATAVAAADAYDVFLRTHNASIMAQFTRLVEKLGCTITDRKKSRIELEEPPSDDEDEEAADQAVQGWQGRLHSVT